MAFVNEDIPEEDKKRFSDISLWQNQNPLRSGPIDLYRWTIDRERNIFTICLGGGVKVFYHYAISIDGEVVKFRAHALATPINGDKINGYDKEWWVFDFIIPPSVQIKESKIKQLIEEAYLAEGNGMDHSRDSTKSVTTHFFKPDVDRSYW